MTAETAEPLNGSNGSAAPAGSTLVVNWNSFTALVGRFRNLADAFGEMFSLPASDETALGDSGLAGALEQFEGLARQTWTEASRSMQALPQILSAAFATYQQADQGSSGQ
jgi:hypothetical protein